jgi:hypothetical protein
MTYRIEIHRQDVSYYAEDGEWLDGDFRLLADHGTEAHQFDPAADFDGWGEPYASPEAWARDIIGQTDVTESSIEPVPAELREHDWLSGRYEDPYTQDSAETAVRLTGDWMPAERARVFAAAVAPAAQPEPRDAANLRTPEVADREPEAG